MNFKRNESGLIEGIEYAYTENGLIDWAKMLKKEHLFVLRENESKVLETYGKPSRELDLTQIDRKYVCILLSGIRYLAYLRGFTKVSQQVNHVHSSGSAVLSCTCTCTIDWMPNFESSNLAVSYSDVAGANGQNVDGFSAKYIESIAANRAYVRAVRGFLNVAIVAKDEIGGAQNQIPEAEPIGNDVHAALQSKLNQKKWTLDMLKKALKKPVHMKRLGEVNPDQWNSIKDIPTSCIFFILGIIQENDDDSKN
jgi:hypothetical protein